MADQGFLHNGCDLQKKLLRKFINKSKLTVNKNFTIRHFPHEYCAISKSKSTEVNKKCLRFPDFQLHQSPADRYIRSFTLISLPRDEITPVDRIRFTFAPKIQKNRVHSNTTNWERKNKKYQSSIRLHVIFSVVITGILYFQMFEQKAILGVTFSDPPHFSP